MKSYSMKLDELTIKKIDHLIETKAVPFKKRADLIRFAVQKLVENTEAISKYSFERNIFRDHRARLNRQAAALIKEQAH